MKAYVQHALGVLGFTLAFLAILFAVAVVASWGPSRWRISSLKSQAAPIIEQIERYRSTSGSYPEHVTTVTANDLKNYYGSWNYSRSRDGLSYRLYTGDFKTFVLSYYSSSGWKMERID